MELPVVLHHDQGSDFGVIVPDLPGCYSAGDTIEEALVMAREAIELHLEGLREEGMAIPTPLSLEQHKNNPDFDGGIWAIVTVDYKEL